MRATRIAIGLVLGLGLAGLVPPTAISALAQSNSTATTGQQGPSDQQGQQSHRHSHHHAQQGTKSGAQPSNPQ